MQWLLALGCLSLPWCCAAQAQPIEVRHAQLEFADGGWNLSADFNFELPGSLEDAVSKGVTLYFLVEFGLIRPRWYWFNQREVSATRVARLSFHPLMRQYRVSTGGLSVSFSRLKDAVDFIRRVRGWRVFEPRAVRPGETVQIEVRMRLDVTQLPKPFRIDALDTRDWNLASDWKRFAFLIPEAAPAALAPQSAAWPPAVLASRPALFARADAPGLAFGSGWGLRAGMSHGGASLPRPPVE